MHPPPSALLGQHHAPSLISQNYRQSSHLPARAPSPIRRLPTPPHSLCNSARSASPSRPGSANSCLSSESRYTYSSNPYDNNAHWSASGERGGLGGGEDARGRGGSERGPVGGFLGGSGGAGGSRDDGELGLPRTIGFLIKKRKEACDRCREKKVRYLRVRAARTPRAPPVLVR